MPIPALLRTAITFPHARRIFQSSVFTRTSDIYATRADFPSLSRFYADYLVVKVPHMADSISEGTLKEWHKQPGEFVKADEEVTRIETDKIDVAVNAPKSGVIVEVFSKPDDTVLVGADLFKLELKDSPPEGSIPPKEVASQSAPAPSEASPSPVSEPKSVPQAKKPEFPSVASATVTPAQAAGPTEVTPVASLGSGTVGVSPRGEEKVKMTRMRLRIAERLKAAQNTAASLTTFNEVDLSTLMQVRARFNERWVREHGIKLGFMSLFMRASVYAINAVPVINARIENDSIVYPSYVDMSVAVATPKGLVTPIVRDCHTKSILALEKDMAALSKRARDNQLTVEDMAGGTFTISNGGVFGSLFGTPILNLPQSAILGMHAIKERPVVVNGKIEIRPMMYVCLTYDHRLIDGREAVTFLVKLKESLEDPMHFLLQ